VLAEQPLEDAQTPPWQVRPVPHETQAAPLRPQAALTLPDWQTPLRQHPELQVELSHPTTAHLPAVQVVPVPH